MPPQPLPSSSIGVASRNDPLARDEQVEHMARAGQPPGGLGNVSHPSPASGYGEWPRADEFIADLSA